MLSGLPQPEKVSDAFEHRGWAAHSEESWLALMPDAELKYSLNAVKKAGKALRDGAKDWDELISSQEILENWHACHSYPLGQFYDSLSQFARMSSPLTNVVQRRKRLDAILAKLRKNRNMQLSTMQDIAGCRAIVQPIDEIERLITICRDGWKNHESFDTDDYIAKPNEATGYRGIHLIYRFKSENKSFNGRFVEVQFRSHLQHAWATAVEIVDLFQKQSLKSGEGEPKWQRFFALMASAIAEQEAAPLVPNTPSGRALESELRSLAHELQVDNQFRAYGSFAGSVQRRFLRLGSRPPKIGSSYFLMDLDLKERKFSIREYSEKNVQQAYRDVADKERDNKNVVLVAAEDLEKLLEAYPNWSIDAHNFLMTLKMTIGEDFTF